MGLLTTAFVVVLGTAIGAIAGYYGGWTDTILSRITDIFFAVPFVLAAIVILSIVPTRSALAVAARAGLLRLDHHRPHHARRGAEREEQRVRHGVQGARHEPAAPSSGKHVLPNSAAPIIVYSTVALGTFIVAEATLTFLGIGLRPVHRLLGR